MPHVRLICSSWKMGIRLSAFFIAISLFSSGCMHLCTESMPQMSLGEFDASKAGSTLSSDFTCPETTKAHPTDPGLFTLAFPDMNEIRADASHYGSPDWALKLRIEITDASNEKSILSNVLSRQQMQFTNWHGTIPSVVLTNTPDLSKCLQPGKAYHLLMRVEQDDAKLGKAEVFYNWIQWR